MQSRRWPFQFAWGDMQCSQVTARHHSDKFGKRFGGKPNCRFNTGEICGLKLRQSAAL
jgi:hypothetical protein